MTWISAFFKRLLSRVSPAEALVVAALAALTVGLVVHQALFIGDWRVDDAYITFSFSKNLGTGYGPVFSHGVRVEGYSNFLWMVLLAPYFLVSKGLSVYQTARVLEYGFLAGLAVSTFLLARRQSRPWLAMVPLVLLGFSTDMIRACISGLETVPFIALLTAGLTAYLWEAPDRRRWSMWLLLGAALMRIDGFVPAVFVLGFELVSAWQDRRLDWKRMLRWAGPPLAVFLLYFGWRWAYYGLPLPTTYYAKQLVTSNSPLRAYDQAWTMVRDWGLIAMLPFALVGLARRPSRDALFLALFVLYQGAYVLRVGGDWMPFYRFWLPVLPALFVLSAWGLEAAWAMTLPLRKPFRLAGLVAALVLWGWTAKRIDAHWADSPQEQDKLGEAQHVAQHTRNNLLNTWTTLRWVLREPGEKLVTDYGGVFGMYVDAQIIEMWGLCNAQIATQGNTDGINPIYGRTCVPCYKDLDPDYFHVAVPLLREPKAFSNHQAVINAIFQGPAIDRIIDLKHRYATGRVLDTKNNKALFFLEKRRQNKPLVRREPAPNIVVDYPFEPQTATSQN